MTGSYKGSNSTETPTVKTKLQILSGYQTAPTDVKSLYRKSGVRLKANTSKFPDYRLTVPIPPPAPITVARVRKRIDAVFELSALEFGLVEQADLLSTRRRVGQVCCQH